MALMIQPVVNVVFAGLGGQGVLKGSDILADAVLRSGMDVKKSEIHGMSQRGGSVTSDVRFGAKVLSPMVPVGEADFLVVLAPDQVERNRPYLKKGGRLIAPDAVAADVPAKGLNVALLGVLSRYLELDQNCWKAAIRANLPPKAHEANLSAFELARSTR